MRRIIDSLIVSFVLLGPLAARGEFLHVTSYNTGMLEKGGVDFVPCIAERLKPQIETVFSSSTIAPKNRPFVILLQEVWTRAAFEAYKKAAVSRGLSVAPTKFSEIQSNGQMTVTNLKIRAARFTPFTSESYAGRGIRSIEVQTSRGPLLIANVHTSYSDATAFLPAHRDQFKQITRNLWPASTRMSLIVGGDFNAGRRMGFKGGTYDPRSSIYENALAPAFEALGMRVIGDPDAVTWDEENNALVYDPTRIIRWTNFLFYGGTSWDMTSSRLDNIFASMHLREVQTGRTMMQTLKLAATCTGHADRTGRMHLSDHYGIFAVFAL